MNVLRRSFRDHPRLLLWLAALAFVVRLLVPAGYMPSAAGRLAIVACPGLAVAGHMMRGHAAPADHAAPDMPCAFAGLGASAIGTGDPPPLAAALAVATAVAIRPPSAPPVRDAVRWRPPLRAPPRSSIR